MFIDICGFSDRPMWTLEEQDMTLRVLNLFFTEMIRIAEEYGGQVEKNTGDGLMIYFNDGDGQPAEHGAKRAVACALTMMTANKNLIGPILVATGTQVINFRVSIDWGAVTIARLGAAKRFNANTAIGTTANFASKMLRHAKANEIVIGEKARLHLPTSWLQWTEKLPVETGWKYIMRDTPYHLYKYNGRWTNS